MLKREFKHLSRKKKSSRKGKIAVCLAGGGITGSMYEVGCLKAMDTFLGEPGCVNEFDIFVGISAGSIVSALLANGYTAHEMFDVIGENRKSPLNFKRKNIYNLRVSEAVRALVPLFRRLPRLVRYGWVNRRHASLMDLLSILQEFIPPGLFSLHNLDKFMASVFYPEGKTNDFRNLERELYIPATNLDTGERWVFGEDDDSVPISNAVAASAAIPLFFRPFRINGVDYIDGSTSQVAHVDIAIRNGAKLIVIINPTMPVRNDLSKNLLPTFDGKWGRIAQKGLGAISEQARRIETKTRFEFGFENFKRQHPDIDYIIIQPEVSDGFLFLHGVMEYDSRRSILEYGYRTTLAQLDDHFERYQKILDKHGILVSHRPDLT